ncbi:MAG TPA: transposase [Candidatus Acidoferrum sp.]|jgi:putative transposase
MPKRLKRYYGKRDLHFLTFSCCRRLPLLGTMRARDLFVHELGRVRAQHGFRLIGYVVMPEHVHLLISEPKKGTPSRTLQVLKQRVSRELRKRRRKSLDGQLQLGFVADGEELPHFWQARFYDFNVYSYAKMKEKLHYMHANLVIRGLVQHARDWPWSSWSFYSRSAEGLISIDSLEDQRNERE